MEEALGVEGTGRSVINEVCRSLRGDFERWQDRSLETHKVMYLFLDGTYLKLRPEDRKAIAVLCAYAMTWDDRKVLLHLAVGDQESAACWEGFLDDMKARGLKQPLRLRHRRQPRVTQGGATQVCRCPGKTVPGA